MSGAMNFTHCGSVLVTGASRGLWQQTVDSLASGGFSPGKIITTRNKAREQAEAVNQESIAKTVEELGQLVREEGLNCLVSNSGINVVADFNTVMQRR